MNTTDMTFSTALELLSRDVLQSAFALCRVPEEEKVYLVWQQSDSKAQQLPIHSVGMEAGFVVAPFAVEDTALLIRGECMLEGNYTDIPLSEAHHTFHSYPADRVAYSIAFKQCHEALSCGCVQKVVLSKTQIYTSDDAIDFIALFHKACLLYPQQYVALWHTAQSGLWLVATPEPLLLAKGQEIQTVALAGTVWHTKTPSWNTKNCEEQAMVADYVASAISPYTKHLCVDGPHTLHAGHLTHLRTTFTAERTPDTSLGQLLSALHPTPAVCGLPRKEAQRVISQVEPQDRGYYTGFSALVRSADDFKAYVTLRCLQAVPEGVRLYAGGGLLLESQEEEEWQETENKLQTMRQLLD